MSDQDDSGLHGAERREVLGANVSAHRPDPRDVAARLRGGCSSVADHDEAIESLLFLDRELRVAREELNDCREARGGSDTLRTQRNYLATERDNLRARVDLLEGRHKRLVRVVEGVAMSLRADSAFPARDGDAERHAKRLEAALDVATRSADTDGDAVPGLHLASLDGAPGDGGADLTEQGGAE